jgi:hypothetical protein
MDDKIETSQQKAGEIIDPGGRWNEKGEQRNFDPVSTIIQGQHILSEGQSKLGPGNILDQGGHGNELKTSQQNAGDHSSSESE